MIGHHRPITAFSLVVHAVAAAVVALCAHAAAARELDVRLRLAWGSGAQAPQRWTGAISAADAQMTDLQPLGIEADEAAAVQLVDNQVRVAPIIPRAFDGCDVSIRGDEAALVTIRLHNVSAADAKEVQVSLGQLASEQFSAKLDELGGYLLVQRAPGDKLRVRIERDHLVFSPGEAISLTVEADANVLHDAMSPVLQARLHRVGGGNAALWQADYPIPSDAAKLAAVELLAPAEEGAYRLSLSVPRPGRFTDKLVPWEQSAPVATRDVEFVVIDPGARLPRLTDKWDVVETINPTSSKWWEQVPAWTQLDRLPLLSAPRSLGNVKPLIPPGAPKGFVELPTPAVGAEPNWQAYPLTGANIGQPHAIEIELPANARQQLAISIIEPDAAGRVLSFGREATLYQDGGIDGLGGDVARQTDRQRMVFWPRTASPLLLVVNHSPSRPAEYGAIRLFRRAEAAAPADVASTDEGRVVAAYLGSPRLADALGAAEILDGDPAGGLSVDGWSTFLDASLRLAQELRTNGFNAAVVCVAGEGSSLAAIDALGVSPRYDTGALATSGADPLRKDVLEALLRVFDREGLRLIPVIDLAAPLPALEALRRSENASGGDVECVGADGRTWAEHHPGEAMGAHYNLLDPRVQSAVAGVIDELINRYGKHPALGGVALEISGRGYGALPGLAWCLDDATTRRFAEDAKIELPSDGADRFQKRAIALQGPHVAPWRAWRQAQLTRFYADVAARLQAKRPELQLVLSTEHLFSGPEATQRLRQAVGGRGSLDEAAAELGVDLQALAATPGLCLLRPRRLASDEALQARALDLQINAATELDQALLSQPQSGELLYHVSRRLRLPSFDAQSPFGPDKTFLALNPTGAPTGDAARRPLAAALAGRDFFTLAEGGELLPLVHDAASIRQRRVFQELPGGEAEVRVERRQPVTLRVYRGAAATTVCMINESPWPVDVQLPLEAAAPTPWRELGGGETPSESGACAAGEQPWHVTIPPYGIAARRYETRSLRVGSMTPTVNDAARAALTARIGEIEQRMRSLDVERAYLRLENSDFESASYDQRMVGWQARIGKLGAATIDGSAAHGGARALHLRSEDALGVAAQSQLFPIPATGQLVVRAQVRAVGLAPTARVYAWIEYDADGTIRRPPPIVLTGPRADGDWSICEASFDNLPMAATGQMRVQFHVAGPGEAWIDDVELFDLRFAKAQRVDLAKGLFDAKTDLENGRVVDCLRRVDGYWPRYLVEYLPPGPAEANVRIATRPDEAPAAPEKDEDGGVGRRVRNLLPPFIRR